MTLSIMVTAIMPSRRSVVAALRLLGLRNAGTPLLMASTPVRAAQPDENARASSSMSPIVVSGSSQPSWGISCRSALATSGRVPCGQLDQAVPTHPQDREDEQVGRHREERSGLAYPTQVHRRQHDDHGRRDQNLVTPERGDGGRRVLRGRGDRHCDREHVVDEQCAGHRDAGVSPRLTVATS